MVDQAENLRSLIAEKIKRDKDQNDRLNKRKIISLISANGGVGKTTLAVNLSLMLAIEGCQTLLIDMETAHPDCYGFLGVQHYTEWRHAMKDGISLSKAVIKAPHGLHALLSDKIDIRQESFSDEEIKRFFLEIRNFDFAKDFVIMDVGSHVNQNTSLILQGTDAVIMVMTPEKHIMANTYKLLKNLKRSGVLIPVYILINKARTLLIAKKVFKQLEETTKKYLELEVKLAGNFMLDKSLKKSVDDRRPIVLTSPASSIVSMFSLMLEKDPFFIKNNEKMIAQKISNC